jgi:hypothetical protein
MKAKHTVKQYMTEYQPKTGERCSCKRGVQRDNCANCEGTGMVIDFDKIRARALEQERVVNANRLEDH